MIAAGLIAALIAAGCGSSSSSSDRNTDMAQSVGKGESSEEIQKESHVSQVREVVTHE